jgi:hypothetical protein
VSLTDKSVFYVNEAGETPQSTLMYARLFINATVLSRHDNFLKLVTKKLMPFCFEHELRTCIIYLAALNFPINISRTPPKPATTSVRYFSGSATASFSMATEL